MRPVVGGGEYGVMLVPGEGEMPEDWTPLAGEIAAKRITVVGINPADATSERVAGGAAWLTAAGIERIRLATVPGSTLNWVLKGSMDAVPIWVGVYGLVAVSVGAMPVKDLLDRRMPRGPGHETGRGDPTTTTSVATGQTSSRGSAVATGCAGR